MDRAGRGTSMRVMAFAVALAAALTAAPAGSQVRSGPGPTPDPVAGAMLVASPIMADTRHRARTGDASFATAEILLDEAEGLVADAPDVLQRIQAQRSPDKGVRSSPFGPGPIVLVRRLRARETYAFNVEARRNEVLRVAAIGDGDTNIDLTIRDSSGVVVCSDGSRDHYPVCTLNRPRPGTLRVEVVNRGEVWSRVQILTN